NEEVVPGPCSACPFAKGVSRMKYTAAALCSAVLSLCLLPGTGRADPVQADWSYQWTPSTDKIYATGSTTDYIALIPENPGQTTGNSNVPAVALQTVSTSSKNNASTFTHAAYGLGLTITDLASGTSGVLVFTGEFNGTLSTDKA